MGDFMPSDKILCKSGIRILSNPYRTLFMNTKSLMLIKLIIGAVITVVTAIFEGVK